jgi:hypothetical protein
LALANTLTYSRHGRKKFNGTTASREQNRKNARGFASNVDSVN